ncbi:MAG: glycerate kinase [Steroidobacteraceae bacterium]
MNTQPHASDCPEQQLLRKLFLAAVSAADPGALIPRWLPARPKGRTIVVGAGKAAASMAAAFERSWDAPLAGLVVTRYGYGVPCRRIEIVEASHPVPDAAGYDAATRMLALVQSLGPDELVVALISGGGSALLSLPAKGLTLADKQEINQRLLRSGADIAEINCVRKHLSAIKGGWLAASAAPARVVSLIISDVPGDDPGVIASGPTIADPTTFADALAVLQKYGIDKPVSVVEHLQRAALETPKPGDPRFNGHEHHVIATPQRSLEAAAQLAREAGVTPLILSDSLEGEAREVAKVMAALARQVVRYHQPLGAPCVLLSGGETTVTVHGQGQGGRNVEFLLALALQLRGLSGVHALAADTDGVDGQSEVAGAVIDPSTLRRALALGIDSAARLADNDAHRYFAALGDQVITGPTFTNVNDFRAVLIR